MNIPSYAQQLQNRLKVIRDRFLVVLQSSKIETYEKKLSPYLSVGSNPPKGTEIRFRWSKLKPELEREQNKIIRAFEDWHSDFCLLFKDSTTEEDNNLKRLYIVMDSWIRYRNSSDQPRDAKAAINEFNSVYEQFNELLDGVKPSSEAETIIIVDTSAIIDCPDIKIMSNLINITRKVIVVPPTTLKELDELKTGRRDEKFRSRLTAAIKNLNILSSTGNVLEGIQISPDSVFKMLAIEPNFTNLPNWLDPDTNDDRIIAIAIELQRDNPSSNVTVLANDINMNNKALHAGIPVMGIKDSFDNENA